MYSRAFWKPSNVIKSIFSFAHSIPEGGLPSGKWVVLSVSGSGGNLAVLVQQTLVGVACGQVNGLGNILGEGAAVHALVQGGVDSLQQSGIALGNTDDVTSGKVSEAGKLILDGEYGFMVGYKNREVVKMSIYRKFMILMLQKSAKPYK